ncbi:MAG: DUF2142 domain-containing protein, partial [Lachnospiraceae bacterium]|nr:DUF2142 domain-containing protein [Lachnospiraceae bacterium]
MGVQKKTILVFLLLLFLVLAVTAFFSLRGSEAGTAYAGGASAGIITFFLAGIFLVSGAAVLYQRRKKWYGAPEHFYFPAAVCIGCAMIALLPAWNINDFGKHFGAAWHYANRLSGIGSDEDFMLTIREGDTATVRDVFFEEGENFYSPTARSYRNVADGLFAPCESNRNVLYEIDSPRSSGMSFYSAWNYIPFIATFALLRPTGIGMVGLLTLGRICALLLYSSAIFHAIKRMPLPQGKWLMALLAILPVNMMNLTALTYDGVVFAASCLLISSILHLKCLQDAEVGRRDVAELLLSAFLLAA